MTSRCETTDKKLGRECRRVIDDQAFMTPSSSFWNIHKSVEIVRVHRIAIRTANLFSLHALKKAKGWLRDRVARQD